MRYIQHKSGNKLHLTFEVDEQLTHPVCGRRFDSYRMNINVPLGNSCKNCNKRIAKSDFDRIEFIQKSLI